MAKDTDDVHPSSTFPSLPHKLHLGKRKEKLGQNKSYR